MKIIQIRKGEGSQIRNRILEAPAPRRARVFGICKIIRKIINRIRDMVDISKGIRVRHFMVVVIRIIMVVAQTKIIKHKEAPITLNSISVKPTRIKTQQLTPRRSQKPSILTRTTAPSLKTHRKAMKVAIRPNMAITRSRPSAHQGRLSDPATSLAMETTTLTTNGTMEIATAATARAASSRRLSSSRGTNLQTLMARRNGIGNVDQRIRIRGDSNKQRISNNG